MSGPPTRLVSIDAGVFLDLQINGATLEQIGAAVCIFAWQCRGHSADDDGLRRVATYGRAKWRRERDAILDCVRALTNASEVRARRNRPTVSAARRAAILERDGRVCRYCEDTEGPFHIDHIVPISRGGSNRDENLCVACATCNLAKSAKLASEWL